MIYGDRGKSNNVVREDSKLNCQIDQISSIRIILQQLEERNLSKLYYYNRDIANKFVGMTSTS